MARDKVSGWIAPRNRVNNWEVDFSVPSQPPKPGSKSHCRRFWARQPKCVGYPSAREWHWVNSHQLRKAGVRDPRLKTRAPLQRIRNVNGYVIIPKSVLNDEQRQVADKFNLWIGRKTSRYVLEHRLVAAVKYQQPLKGFVVRHINGIRHDNRPENLVLGTHQENVNDHVTARLDAIRYREQFEKAIGLAYTIFVINSLSRGAA